MKSANDGIREGRGSAYKVTDLGADVPSGGEFFSGSTLYRVEPPVEVSDGDGFLTETSYVIVAVTPAAKDHGEPETKAFAAEADGGTFVTRPPDGKEEPGIPAEDGWSASRRMTLGAADLDATVVGSYDHEGVLGALQSGYGTVDRAPEEETSFEVYAGRYLEVVEEMRRRARAGESLFGVPEEDRELAKSVILGSSSERGGRRF